MCQWHIFSQRREQSVIATRAEGCRADARLRERRKRDDYFLSLRLFAPQKSTSLVRGRQEVLLPAPTFVYRPPYNPNRRKAAQFLFTLHFSLFSLLLFLSPKGSLVQRELSAVRLTEGLSVFAERVRFSQPFSARATNGRPYNMIGRFPLPRRGGHWPPALSSAV